MLPGVNLDRLLLRVSATAATATTVVRPRVRCHPWILLAMQFRLVWLDERAIDFLARVGRLVGGVLGAVAFRVEGRRRFLVLSAEVLHLKISDGVVVKSGGSGSKKRRRCEQISHFNMIIYGILVL